MGQVSVHDVILIFQPVRGHIYILTRLNHNAEPPYELIAIAIGEIIIAALYTYSHSLPPYQP